MLGAPQILESQTVLMEWPRAGCLCAHVKALMCWVLSEIMSCHNNVTISYEQTVPGSMRHDQR
jgi:hypothetical protein